MAIRISLLKWNHYNGCKRLFQNLFDISEHPWFHIEWQNRCSHSSFVALYYDTVVAFVLVDTHKTIHYICVEKQFQNESLGSRLLQHVIDVCKGGRNLRLVTADDERLVNWYKRYGFQVTHEYLDTDGDFVGADMVLRQRRTVSV
jgi:ribosomal protein S18 acetylase RimI-like enzyme